MTLAQSSLAQLLLQYLHLGRMNWAEGWNLTQKCKTHLLPSLSPTPFFSHMHGKHQFFPVFHCTFHFWVFTFPLTLTHPTIFPKGKMICTVKFTCTGSCVVKSFNHCVCWCKMLATSHSLQWALDITACSSPRAWGCRMGPGGVEQTNITCPGAHREQRACLGHKREPLLQVLSPKEFCCPFSSNKPSGDKRLFPNPLVIWSSDTPSCLS